MPRFVQVHEILPGGEGKTAELAVNPEAVALVRPVETHACCLYMREGPNHRVYVASGCRAVVQGLMDPRCREVPPGG